MVTNGSSLQGLYTQTCGHYALMYLKTKARGYTLQDFVKNFSETNRVQNDHRIGLWLKRNIANDQIWSCAGQQTCLPRT